LTLVIQGLIYVMADSVVIKTNQDHRRITGKKVDDAKLAFYTHVVKQSESK